jgi:hypothetical protein
VEKDQFHVIRARFYEVGKLPSDDGYQAGLSPHAFVIGHRAMRIADSDLGKFHGSGAFLVVVSNVIDTSAHLIFLTWISCPSQR